MGCTVSELLHRISSKELAEWMAFERVYGPIGQARDDWHAAIIAHKVVSMLRDPAKGREPQVKDFLPTWGE